MTKALFRKKVINALTFASIALFALGLMLFPRETSAAAAESLGICANVLIPSLFPFFVVSAMAINTGLAAVVGRVLTRPMRWVFALPGACAPVFILGLIGGYPVGAKAAIELYTGGLCSKAEAERLLSFCNNSGPAFMLGAAGAVVFGTTAAGVLLYGSHVLASVAVGVIFRGYKRKSRSSAPSEAVVVSAVPLSRAFTSAVGSALSSILNICAFVVFFSVAIRLLVISGVLPVTAAVISRLMSPIGLDAALAEKLLSGLLEMTSGVYGLISTNAALNAKLSAAAFMMGWAGISVHCQVLNFIGETGLSTLPYVMGKMLHGVLSALFAFIGAWMLPYDTQVSKTVAGHLDALSGLTPLRSLTLSLFAVMSVWVAFMIASVIFACKSRKKRL